MKVTSQKGFSLIEMVMTMAIFSVVIMIVTSSFAALLKFSSKVMKSEESNIGGIVGLEMMRHDISSVGYGLPTSYNISGMPTYSEVDSTHSLAAALNDSATLSPGNRIPRALVGTPTPNVGIVTDTGSDGNNYQTLGNSDYLALKATSLGSHSAAQNWSYLNYTPDLSSGTSLPPKTWPTKGSNLNDNEVVIALNRSVTATAGGYDLLQDHGNFYTTYNHLGLSSSVSPRTPQDVVYLYGLAGPNTVPRMPFNRVDYVVASPEKAGMRPGYCAPHTGILYRAQVQHDAGELNYQPVLDCVAAMRVVLGWNMLDSSGSVVTDPTKTGSGMVDTWTNLAGDHISCTGTTPPSTDQMHSAVSDPAQISTKLKVIKVYIVAQDGNRDASFTSPSPLAMYSSEEGTTPLGSSLATFTVPGDMLNYRWKVYKIIVRPKNLASNQ